MINTTDLSEFEVLLPGSWERRSSGEIYTFTADQMTLRDERLFKQLYISDGKGGSRHSVPYALTIENDYCGILAGDEEYIITSITKHPDGSLDMEWKDRVNTLISFHRNA